MSGQVARAEWAADAFRPPSLEIRKAQMRDIAPLLGLINGYARAGVMLPRTEFEVSEHIRDFSVAYIGPELAGCAGLHFYSPVIGEIRSLAVAEKAKNRGIGSALIQALVAEAEEFSLGAVFAFTYVLDFFRRAGFHEVERGALPLKAWKDCVRCPKFHSCDEIAVLRILNARLWTERENESTEREILSLPVLKTRE